MTEEQRKWYLAGANDMEAGRLVTKPTVGVQTNSTAEQATIAHVRADLLEAQAENEILREREAIEMEVRQAAEGKLAEAESKVNFGQALVSKLNARLAEVEGRLTQAQARSSINHTNYEYQRSRADTAEAKLVEVGKERDELRVLRRGEQKRGEDLQASMDRAREKLQKQLALADQGRDSFAWANETAEVLDEVVRLLGGSDDA